MKKSCLNTNLKNIAIFAILNLVTVCNSNAVTQLINGKEELNSISSYINLLKFTPISSQSVHTLSELEDATSSMYQKSFSISQDTTIDTIDVTFYHATDCFGDALDTIKLSGPSTLAAGIYYSSDRSNYALCSQYDSSISIESGCSGEANEAFSVKYSYNLAGGTTKTQCISPKSTYVLIGRDIAASDQECGIIYNGYTNTLSCGYDEVIPTYILN